MLLELILVLTLLGLLYKWLESSFTPWETTGIPFFRKPYPIIGTMRWSDVKELRHPAVTVPESYSMGAPHKYFIKFLFHKPLVMIRDPEIVREIGIKAADHFIDRSNDKSMVDIHQEMNRMLIMLTGDEWKKVRAGLSPAFTTGKLKNVAQTIIKSGKRFQDYIKRQRSSNDNGLIEAKALIGQFALSVVGESVYGVSNFDAFAEEESEFIKQCKNTNLKLAGKGYLIAMGYFLFPKLMNFFKLKIIDTEPYNYLSNVTKCILKERRDTKYVGKDMVQVMLDVQEKQKQQSKENDDDDDNDCDQFEKDGKMATDLTGISMDEETILQSTTLFLIAGYDTVGSTVSTVLYYLALHPEIQEQLHQEVDKIADDLADPDAIIYEDFSSMEFMECVIHETMRMAPVTPFIDRLCVKDYQLPDGGFIPKGTLVFFLAMGIQLDPKYFDEPEKFKPSRWLPENRGKITPYTELGFGIGPRNCIGKRFAMMEMKTCLFYMFRKFSVKPSEKTPLTPDWEPGEVLTSLKGGNWLKFEDRN